MSYILYDERISNYAAVTVIDGKCTKNRNSARDQNLTAFDIEVLKREFGNIAIQTGKKIEIYCSLEKVRDFEGILNSDPKLLRLKEKGTIKIFSK